MGTCWTPAPAASLPSSTSACNSGRRSSAPRHPNPLVCQLRGVPTLATGAVALVSIIVAPCCVVLRVFAMLPNHQILPILKSFLLGSSDGVVILVVGNPMVRDKVIHLLPFLGIDLGRPAAIAVVEYRGEDRDQQ